MEVAKFNSCVVSVAHDSRSPFLLKNGFIDHPNNVIEGAHEDGWIVIPLYNVTRIFSFDVND